MTPRIGRGLLFLILALALVPVALARGGRGGGGGGARGGGGFAGGGMPRGGGGMPRGGGGGFSRSPSVSAPRPASRPSPGGGFSGAARPGGAPRGGGGPSTLPSRPQVGGGRPGGPGSGPAAGPAGIANRPGIDSRPGGVGGAGGIGNRPGIDNRPGGVGGVGGIGNRPGIDNRPGGVGGIGNRPGIDNRPGGVGGVGGVGNRPGIDNRPGGVGGGSVVIANLPGYRQPARWGRRGRRQAGNNLGGVGGINNRPIVGSGNTINLGRRQCRGDPPEQRGRDRRRPGLRGPSAFLQPMARCVPGGHQGWTNGYWHGYHDNNNWGWGRFAAGAAVGVTAWALPPLFYNWGYASYANPYYAEQPVAQPIVIEHWSPAVSRRPSAFLPSLMTTASPSTRGPPHPPRRSPIPPSRNSTPPARHSARATTPVPCGSPTRR